LLQSVGLAGRKALDLIWPMEPLEPVASGFGAAIGMSGSGLRQPATRKGEAMTTDIPLQVAGYAGHARTHDVLGSNTKHGTWMLRR
jgi:hypothetical protein